MRLVARAGENCTTESRRAQRGGIGGDCRFGGWVRFALVSGWCALAVFGGVWQRLAHGGVGRVESGCAELFFGIGHFRESSGIGGLGFEV